jgi:rRNA maturation RNase YbeY
MSLLFQNLQRVVSLDKKLLKSHIHLLRRLFEVELYDISVTCVTNKKITQLNTEYRGKTEPTDVLAFPFYDDLVPGKLPTAPDHGILDLGDIYLGIPYIYRQCCQNSQRIQKVLPVMVTHGICHLIGYDHDTKEQYELMHAKESLILQEFNKITGYSCSPLLEVGHYLSE